MQQLGDRGAGVLVVDVDVHEAATTTIASNAQRIRTARRYTRDTSDGSKLYVAATGKPYPVAIVGGKNQSGTIAFDDWNKSVSLSAPSDAIDIGQFGG